MVEEIPVFFVDAFVTDKPFSGNPAAVCFLENNERFSDELKQKIAAELSVPTTAFVWKLQPSDKFESSDRFGLQWFTPTVHVDLCGHATIAMSKVIFEIYENPNECLSFETPMAGIVQARHRGNGTYSLNFPNHEPQPVDDEPYAPLIKVVTQDHPYVDVKFSAPTRKLLIRFDDSITREEFEELTPSPSEMLEASPDGSVQGVILTVKANARNGYKDAENNGYDFASRYFTPWKGLDEDHVCGSAHAVLGPYWERVLSTGRELRAKQGSKRGGDLFLTVRTDNRVEIAGKCQLFLKGSINPLALTAVKISGAS